MRVKAASRIGRSNILYNIDFLNRLITENRCEARRSNWPKIRIAGLIERPVRIDKRSERPAERSNERASDLGEYPDWRVS